MRFFNKNDQFNKMQFVTLKDEEYFQKLKYSGEAVSQCLKHFVALVTDQTPNLNLLDIEKECERIIAEHNCVPTFKGYKGFPGAVCLSVNKSLVHGIPKDYILKSGDVVSLDLGAHTRCGVIADAATTVIYGKHRDYRHPQMIKVCRQALASSIKSIRIGERLGNIGQTISHLVKKSGFKLVVDYGGHGLSRFKPHDQPFVSNLSSSQEGIRFQPGMTLAIEPMVVIGSNKTKKLSDKWTVVTKDIGVHEEHTIFLTEDGPQVMTA